ncbi:putative bifunctional diguanylate cyclase/phosphodiesterase [Aureimonas frigidaquae]|uniref:putative bifunctional diguanylate cyclase/phosphodiesterase n=1 Tax=Aureimonas frigidaquae TaxID=424757 RepID=UPI000784AB3F|nr:EAL domain-containing protein [Aureimonas frigidaquae]
MTSVPGQAASLQSLIQRDQLHTMRGALRRAILVNIALGLAALAVTVRAGLETEGLIWFSLSLAVNLVRFALCAWPVPSAGEAESVGIDRHFFLHRVAALASGIVWSLLAVLSSGFTTPETVFYLTLLAGITAGSVTYGTAYWPVPALFISPPLIAATVCLFWSGHFNSVMLSGTIAIYLTALLLAAREGDRSFRDLSRLKHEARALAHSLEQANEHSAATAREMLHRATHDALTGLLNRGGILRNLEDFLREGGGPVCLMLLDLDDFKVVNDVYGHATGDRVLRKVARRLREATPPHAHIARLGGDEFALVLRGMPVDTQALGAIAQAALDRISAPFETFESSPVSGSVGVYVADRGTVGEMLANADAALYVAKTAGRNRYRIYDLSLQKRMELERDMERELPDALRSGMIELWFQPIARPDGSIDSLEALLRWNHSRHGHIDPSLLVSVAVRTDQSEQLFLRVVRGATAMLEWLAAQGWSDMRVAINVSPREAARVPIDQIVMEELGHAGIPLNRLELEITEETALDTSVVRSRFKPLADAGARIVIDDFGVGYASLAAIRHIRISRLKLDRSFAADLDADGKARSLYKALIGLGHALDIEVVAEGVETEEARQTLVGLGCDFLQGYHLARPMPEPDSRVWLQSQHSH